MVVQVGDLITFTWRPSAAGRQGVIKSVKPDPERERGRKVPHFRIGIAFSDSGPFKKKVVGFIGRVQLCDPEDETAVRVVLVGLSRPKLGV